MSSKASAGTSIRKISEDSRLRPFLSSLFDPETYVTNVIAEGRSEECFESIVGYIEDINAEIKTYISMHKDNLMSGMQDVATLAEKYNNLSVSSQKLHATVTRMKKEALDSHNLIATRTLELERIHETTAILHQLKQFATAKTQLDLYLKDTDVRNLSSAAKTLSELEKLLMNPKLMDIKFVRDATPSIKQFGKSIRMMAQERLLAAIVEKNQASIASSLQVFYNLDSLAEVILMVIDMTVKATMEAAGDALDFEQLNAAPAELLNGGSSVSVATAAPPSATKKPPAGSSSHASPVPQMSLSQLRISIRELAHHWSSIVHTKATEIHVFQRVVIKKEDPSTHEKFVDVLKRVPLPVILSSSGNVGSASAEGIANLSHQYLAQGQLLELFWYRLSASLQGVSNDKVRAYPLAASRAYPYLRRAAVEVVGTLTSWTERDLQRDLLGGGGGGFGGGGGGGAGGGGSMFALAGSQFADLESASRRRDPTLGGGVGVFGSLQWSQDDMLGIMSRKTLTSGSVAAVAVGAAGVGAAVVGREEGDSDYKLVTGLKPLRDRYLITALNRMSAPIHQMFPELEGYTAAVPSKRDLQTLIRAIQSEFVLVVVESDTGLLSAVCKEFLKVVKVMLSKIEGMIINSPETRKISSQNNFARTHQQEHNGLLLSLLLQFKEALEKIPVVVVRQATQEVSSGILSSAGESAGASISAGIAATPLGAAPTASAQEAASAHEISEAVKRAVGLVEDLAQRQIMDSIVALLSGYIKSVLLGMHKEGVVSSHPLPKAAAGAGPSAEDDTLTDCSLAVQAVVRQFPVIFKTHIQSLSKCRVVDNAIEEICLRTMHAYVSIAALTRPVNELTRLRAAKDMTALEMLLSSVCAIPNQDKCPVVQEFRAFRRLLFQTESESKNTSKEDSGATSKSKTGATAGSDPSKPPSRTHLFQLEYISHVRPSTLLGYCISCAPAQLLSPYDVSPEASLAAYIEDLTLVHDPSSQSHPDQLRQQHMHQHHHHHHLHQHGSQTIQRLEELKRLFKDMNYSVRSLYAVDAADWKSIENEVHAWNTIQVCLESFFKRISVAEGAQKQNMRGWYEAILDIGSQSFGGHR